MSCNCSARNKLVDISNTHAQFVAGMRCLATGDWIKLLECPDCGQLWRADEWDKYRPMYALKLNEAAGWESVDIDSLIKQRIVASHGGLDASICLAKDCKLHALKGRAYCVNHFYA